MKKTSLKSIICIIFILLSASLATYIYIYTGNIKSIVEDYEVQIKQLQEENRDLQNNLEKTTPTKTSRIIESEPENSFIMPEYSLLEEYNIDIDKDSKDESVELYADVGIDDQGNYIWDDGQKWLLLVRDDDQLYVLYHDYVQIGNIKLYLYETYDDNAGIYITTIRSTTAGLIINDYIFDNDNNQFIEELLVYKGNINNFTIY